MAEQTTTHEAPATGMHGPRAANEDHPQVDGDALGAALDRGRQAQAAADEAASQQQSAWRRSAETEASGGWLGKVAGMIVGILKWPFAVVVDVTRRLMGKVTGEDLVSKVRQSKQEMNELNETHEHMENKLAERMRDQQREMSRMHYDQEMMAGKMDGHRAGMAREGEQLGEGPESASNPAAGDQEETREAAAREMLGLPGPANGHERITPEQFAHNMKEFIEQIEPSAVSRDLVNREDWLSWAEEGANSVDIKEQIVEQFSRHWMKVFQKVRETPENALTLEQKRVCAAAMFEAQLTANSDVLLAAAKASEKKFQHALLQQIALCETLVGEGDALKKLDKLVGAAKGDFSQMSDWSLDGKLRNEVDEHVFAAFPALNKHLSAWQARTDPTRGVVIIAPDESEYGYCYEDEPGMSVVPLNHRYSTSAADHEDGYKAHDDLDTAKRGDAEVETENTAEDKWGHGPAADSAGPGR